MADHSSDVPQKILNALLSSGFPFQTAIAQLVRQANGYSVIAEEFPWQHETGGAQFLDLVAAKSPFIIAIECKKTEKEIFTFLQPGGMDRDVNRSRCIYLSHVQYPTGKTELLCGDWRLMPKSAESAFCVVSTSESGKDQRLLERDAQRLIQGGDAYARHRQMELDAGAVVVFDSPVVPVVVTNAELFVAQYDPNEVSLTTGKLPMPQPATVAAVDWVRFRKPFTSSDVGDRTVFVVRAAAFTTWLAKLDMIQMTPDRPLKVAVRSVSGRA